MRQLTWRLADLILTSLSSRHRLVRPVRLRRSPETSGLNILKQSTGTHTFYFFTTSMSAQENVSSVSSSIEADRTDSCKNGEKAMSKKAQKRLARVKRYQEIKKQRKEATKQAHKNDPGYSEEDLNHSHFYFENGLRKVYPYSFIFATHTKGRWVGRTIEDVLQKEFGYDHEDDLQRSFDAGQICVNNKRVGPNFKLRNNDYLSHSTHRHENSVTDAEMEILEDTDDLIVINKPSSIPCHPCGRYRFNSVVFILGKEMGYTNLRNIYRLDRLTSGVLILAKTIEMTKTLEDQVVNRQVQKEYVCRVVGHFPQGPVLVDQPLRPLSNKLRLQVVCPTGKASQTEFTRLSYNGTSSVVRCRPFTGRTHQIRVHLQYLGHPIINDAFYNNPAWGPNGGKDGDYEVPFDEVCARILKEHHANLWDGGENPLYFKKLKEMEEKLAKSCPIQAGTPSSDINFDSKEILEKDMSKQVSNVSSIETTQHSTDLVSSNIEEDEHLSSNGMQSCQTECTSDSLTNLEPPNKKNKIFDEGKINSSVSLSNQVPVALDNATDSHQSPSSPELSSVQKLSSQAANSGQKDGQPIISDNKRPGFEWDKWTIDPLCELCKKLPIDPREKDLVMFLHALKYKGPDWEYETKLPEWAKDEWNLEEDYV